MDESIPPPPPPSPGPPSPPRGQPPPLPDTWSSSTGGTGQNSAPTAHPGAQSPSRLKKFLAPLGVLGIVLWKLKAIFVPLLKYGKFLPALLKTGGTMLLSIGVYATQWGWKFAVGFVLLIFLHECGHLIAARRFGLAVSAPMFIPFVGALIMLKDSTRDAWVESWIGISGPLLGALASAVCHGIYLATGEQFFAGLAYTGYFLNLFNLAPIGFLDGGRIVTAISPWLWLVGAVCLVTMLFLQFNFIVLLILIMSAPRLFSLFRKKSEAEKRYFEIAPWQRVVMSLMYFGLIAVLLLGMSVSRVEPATRAQRVAAVQDAR